DAVRVRVDRAYAVFQGAGKEGVEVVVGVRVFLCRFTHVDVEATQEHLDEIVFHEGYFTACQVTHQSRQQMVRQDQLQQGKKSFQQVVHEKASVRNSVGKSKIISSAIPPGYPGGCPTPTRSRHSRGYSARGSCRPARRNWSGDGSGSG